VPPHQYQGMKVYLLLNQALQTWDYYYPRRRIYERYSSSAQVSRLQSH